MKVALDTNALFVTRAGVARYLNGLRAGFARLGPAAPDVTELAWPVPSFAYGQPLRAIKTAYRELLWPRWVAGPALRRLQPDILHITSAIPYPQPDGVRCVATLYDLAVLRQPERFRRWHATSTRRRLQRLRTMDRIICISRFTADEAMSLLSLPASRLDVVPLGCDGPSDEPARGEQPGPAFEPPQRFFLFVGSLEPGKNLALLHRVYAQAQNSGVSLPPLAIVGARWAGVPAEARPPDAWGWVYAGRQPDAVLNRLYRSAVALVFPSRYEGFGLPPLEAMREGCPVICSPVASLPEVVGDAACLVDSSPAAYLDALRRMDCEDSLRRELSERGRRRAAGFTWLACAEGTLDVYRKALGL